MPIELNAALDVSPLVAILRQLPDRLDARVDPMRTAFDRASLKMMRWQRGRYVSASGGDGTWADLKPRTKRARLRRQAGAAKMPVGRDAIAQAAASVHLPILIETGALEAALFQSGAPGHFVNFTRDGIAEGANNELHPSHNVTFAQLAATHNAGDRSRNLPARTVMGTPDENVTGQIMSDLAVGVNAVFQQLAQSIAPGVVNAA